MSTVELEPDGAPVQRSDEQATAAGRPRSEVIAEALPRQLDGGRLRKFGRSDQARVVDPG